MYWVFSSFDGQDDESAFELIDGAASDGFPSSLKVNGGDGQLKTVPRQLPRWLSNSTPNEFVVCLKIPFNILEGIFYFLILISIFIDCRKQ